MSFWVCHDTILAFLVPFLNVPLIQRLIQRLTSNAFVIAIKLLLCIIPSVSEFFPTSFEESCSLWPLKAIPCSSEINTARIIILMIWILRSYFSSEYLSWVTDLVGSSYDSKISFTFSNASLWYSLVSWLTTFSDLPTYWNTVSRNLPRSFHP